MGQSQQQSDRLYIAVSKNRQIHGYICSVQNSVEQIQKSSIEKMHAVFAKISSFTNLLRQQYDNNTILQDVLTQFDLEIIGSRPIQFYCSCSRDSIVGIINSLSHEEFVRFIQDDGTINAVCEYCNKAYRFKPGELKQNIQ